MERAENVRKAEYQNFKNKISTHAGKISEELSVNLAVWERLKTATRQREYELMEIDDLKSAEKFTVRLEDINSERPCGMSSMNLVNVTIQLNHTTQHSLF